MKLLTVELKLQTQKYQEDILNKRLEIARNIHNSLLNVVLKRYKEMIKTKKYRALLSSLTGNKVKDGRIWHELYVIHKRNRMTESDFWDDVKPIQKLYKKNIDSFTAQKIATRLWKQFDKLLKGEIDEIHFKKIGTYNILEGKSSKTGIMFVNNQLHWLDLHIPAVIDDNKLYEYQSLKYRIIFCRILRKTIKNKHQYYVQILFVGKPLVEIDKNSCEQKHKIGNEDGGMDIGTSTIAIASETDAKISKLADRVQNIQNERRGILRKIDKSDCITNPEMFNEDGTIKVNNNERIKWNKSNKYIKYKNKLKEIYRKQKAVLKYQHECLVNFIISLGNHICAEKNSFFNTRKRSTKTKIDEKGEIQTKKRFGNH